MDVISYIIKQQQEVMGPVAIELANHVKGLKVNQDASVTFTGDRKDVLSALVQEYASLFGQASIEVCKDAVREVKPPVPQDQLPAILQ